MSRKTCALIIINACAWQACGQKRTILRKNLDASSSPSAHPTYQPSVSIRPTISWLPSSYPSSTPTLVPSFNTAVTAKRYYIQTFSAGKEFETGEVAIFTKLLENYTDVIGYGVTPHIVTNATVISQLYDATSSELSINYSMNYTTKYPGYNITDYPTLFYESKNMTVLTNQLIEKEFPPLAAIELVMLDPDTILTASPTLTPTSSPIVEGSAPTFGDGDSDAETTLQSNHSSTTVSPSLSPPTDGMPSKTREIGLGLGVGIFVAAIVGVGFFFTWMRLNPRKKANAAEDALEAKSAIKSADQEAGDVTQEHPSLLIINPEEMKDANLFSDDEFYCPPNALTPQDADLEAVNPDVIQAGSDASSPTQEQGGIVSLLIRDLDGSSTSSNENLGDFSQSEDTDIFDSYKNNQLEKLREGVTAIVFDTEGMLSLAMTESLIDDGSHLTAESILDGAGNPSEIEANFLFETNDWMKKNRETPSDTYDFFQGILNKMVVIVRIGVIHPLDATRVIYCCAALLGLELLKDCPNDMLLVLGMRKTNDASQGRTHLVAAFQEFGAIEGAAIAVDKGFGFVRFSHPISADRALERFRTGEIEVQDVSVMIERPQMTQTK